MTTRTVKWLSAFVVLVMLAMIVPQTASAEKFPTMVITEDTVLTADLNAHVVIGADGITLDGAGHAITGDNKGVGINLTGRSGVTVMNCEVSLFKYGIFLNSSYSNTLANNTAGPIIFEPESFGWGIPRPSGFFLKLSSQNILRDNIAHDTAWGPGFLLIDSDSNTLTDNMADDCRIDGFDLLYSDHNVLTGNTANGSRWGHGFVVYESNHNTLAGNAATGNDFEAYGGAGFTVDGRGNKILNNTAEGNWVGFGVNGPNHVRGNLATGNHIGFGLWGENSTIFGNTAVDNWAGFYLTWGPSNYCWGVNLVQNTATDNNYGFYLEWRVWCCGFIKNEATGNRVLDLSWAGLVPAGLYGGRNRFVNNVFGTTGPHYWWEMSR